MESQITNPLGPEVKSYIPATIFTQCAYSFFIDFYYLIKHVTDKNAGRYARNAHTTGHNTFYWPW